MDIVHHIGFNTISAPNLLNALSKFSLQMQILQLPGQGGKIVTFDLFESDMKWVEVYNLLKEHRGFDIYKGGDIFDTVFSEEEIRSSDWLRLIPTFENGYPQPSRHWPFKQMSLVNVCSKCGVYKQNAPMRITGEPRMGKNSFMSLIAGEIFAKLDFFSFLKKMGAVGYEDRDVIIHRTKQPSQTIKQLFIQQVAESGLEKKESLRQVQCPVCGVIKYYPHMKGKMRIRKDVLFRDVDFWRSEEWFGVGLVLFRETLISNRVASFILDQGLKCVKMKVVELV